MNGLYLAWGMNVSTRVIRDIAYIYLEDRNELMSLNETGSEVWSLINGRRTTAEIADIVTDSYEVDQDEVRHFVTNFLHELFEKGVLTTSDVPFEGVMAYG